MASQTKPKGVVRPLDNLFEKARNRIYRVGIELEGGWDKLPERAELTHDGSVRFRASRGEEVPPLVGELPSPPLEVGKWKPWVKQWYPHHINETCGMHVHVSFQNALNYQRLMTPDYTETVLAYLSLWAKRQTKSHPTGKKGISLNVPLFPSDHYIWPRLMGQNDFCRKYFDAEEQAQRREKSHSRSGPGNRYTAINYCYGQHNTLECRTLPMMDSPDVACDAIEEFLRITNAFLVTNAKREEKIKSAVEAEGHNENYQLVEIV